MTVENNLEITKEVQQELEIYQILKPYIAHCLNLNHDLNNPLAGIIGYSEFLMDDDSLSKEQKHFIKQIITCAERMQKMIEKLCEEKISLNDKIDLSSVTESYQAVAKSLD